MACRISTLQTEACTNGFTAVSQNEQLYRIVLLQLFCAWSEIPNGNVFAGGQQVFAGGNAVFAN